MTSSVAWESNVLSTSLMNSQMNEKQFNQCLNPLKYMLYPIGIFNIFPDYKPKPLYQVYSYLYVASLLLISFYTMDPKIDAWLSTIDANNNTAQSIALRSCFIDHQFSSIAAYIYLRFYFFRKQKLLKLLKALYEYIDETAAEISHGNGDNKSDYFQKYCSSIHDYCKILCIFFYSLFIFNAISWTMLTFLSLHTTSLFSYCITWLFNFQVYWPILSLVLVLLIVLRILTLYYFVYTSKIYYYHISVPKHDKHVAMDIVDMDELQKVFVMENEMELKQNMERKWSVYDMKQEYIQMVRLWNKNAEYWNIIFIVAVISIMVQILQGFIFFFAVTTWSFFISALLMWLWGMVVVTMYLIQLSRANTTADDLKELVAIVDGKSDGDNVELVKFIQFIEIHRCCFKICGVEITWSLTYALLVTSASPLLTYLFSYFVTQATL